MLTRHKKPGFVLMSYEHYERMRTGGDPRRAYHISEMPDEHAALFDEAIDRLARGEGTAIPIWRFSLSPPNRRRLTGSVWRSPKSSASVRA